MRVYAITFQDRGSRFRLTLNDWVLTTRPRRQYCGNSIAPLFVIRGEWKVKFPAKSPARESNSEMYLFKFPPESPASGTPPKPPILLTVGSSLASANNQKMTNVLINNLIRQLREIENGSLWFDQSFKDKIDHLSEEDALTKPMPQIHSVAEHVSHMLQ